MPGFFLLLLAITSCNNAQQEINIPSQSRSATIQPTEVGTIPLPKGYVRIKAEPGSYTDFLRRLPLKKENTVYLFNGLKKRNQEAQYAVLNMDIGKKDLQQCADAAMRLRAEYLFAQKKYGDITFHFTNGFNCDYSHYAKGYRVNINGSTCSWSKQQSEDYTYNTFRQYLELVFAYAGTKSLSQQLRPVPFSAIAPGKILLQSRNPYGHAVTVMDMAYHPQTNDTIFLLSQSYMPAQDIHILRNPMSAALSPWYSTRFINDLETPEWSFTKADLYSF